MRQEDICDIKDVVIYLRQYAIRSHGDQPLVVGVLPDAWHAILKEMGVEEHGVTIIKICDVRVVPA